MRFKSLFTFGSKPAVPDPAPVAPSNPPTSPDCSDPKRTRIQSVFDAAAKAGERRGNPASTLAYIQARAEVDRMPKTPMLKRWARKLGVASHEESRTAKIDRMQRLYTEGVLGRDPDLKQEKKGWRKAARVEWIHTSAARTVNASAGMGAHAVASVGERVAIQQGLGYAPQASLSAYVRLATEVWQILLNDGGKPKLPPNIEADKTSLRDAHAGFRAVTLALREDNEKLRNAIAAATANDASEREVERLRELVDKVAQERAAIGEPDQQYKYRFVAFKRQFMGKKWSAALSGTAIAATAPINAIAPGAGRAAQFATIPAQVAASYYDYLKAQSYTLRAGAKKLDLSLLLKPESRGKPLEALTDADIDTGMASKLYSEQAELVLAATREIYTHKLAELNYQKRKLEKELAREMLPQRSQAQVSIVMPAPVPVSLRWVPTCSADRIRREKEQALQDVTARMEKLKEQIGHFERGETAHLDLDGRIGKALSDPWYFFRKGTDAVFSNKIGEFWAQQNQRVFNSFNPLVSIGEVGIMSTALSAVHGAGFVHEGLHPKGETSQPSAVSDAAAAMVGTQVLAGANSAVTVVAARDHKDIVDRRKLAVPGWIVKGEAVNVSSREDELEDALKKGLISKGRKRRLEEARAILDDTSLPPDAKSRKAAQKRLSKWEQRKEKARAMVDEINREWIIDGLRGKDGKPLAVDLRNTAACYRSYVPLSQRIWIPAKSIPQGMFHSIRLMKDAAQAKLARKEANRLARTAGELIGQGQAILNKNQGAPALPPDLNAGEEFNLTALARALKEQGIDAPIGLDREVEQLLDSLLWKPEPDGTAPVEQVQPAPVLAAADYKACTETVLHSLRKIRPEDIEALEADELQRVTRDLGQLYEGARQLYPTIMYKLSSSACLDPDAFADWDDASSNLDEMISILIGLQAKFVRPTAR